MRTALPRASRRPAPVTIRAAIGRYAEGAGRSHAVAAGLLRQKESASGRCGRARGTESGEQRGRAGPGWAVRRGAGSPAGGREPSAGAGGAVCSGPGSRGGATRAGPDRRGLTAPVAPSGVAPTRAMPSDLAKKKAAKKKEAAKARQRPRRVPDENGDAGPEPQEVRPPEANGTVLPGEKAGRSCVCPACPGAGAWPPPFRRTVCAQLCPGWANRDIDVPMKRLGLGCVEPAAAVATVRTALP